MRCMNLNSSPFAGQTFMNEPTHPQRKTAASPFIFHILTTQPRTLGPSTPEPPQPQPPSPPPHPEIRLRVPGSGNPETAEPPSPGRGWPGTAGPAPRLGAGPAARASPRSRPRTQHVPDGFVVGAAMQHPQTATLKGNRWGKQHPQNCYFQGKHGECNPLKARHLDFLLEVVVRG